MDKWVGTTSYYVECSVFGSAAVEIPALLGKGTTSLGVRFMTFQDDHADSKQRATITH